jgi:DNA-binding response OmpR family regulator
MDSQKTVLVCDSDQLTLTRIEILLSSQGFDVDSISDATQLIPTAIRFHPNIIIANPEMTGFNEYDICKNIMRGLDIPVILILDGNSARTNSIGDCSAEEILTKPVDGPSLVNLVRNICAVHQ